MKEEVFKVSLLVLFSIDDSDLIVCLVFWEVVFYIFIIIEDCWFYVNVKKSVFFKLLIVICEGGWGLVIVIYFYFLLFISKFL